jgi:hypothetical protein
MRQLCSTDDSQGRKDKVMAKEPITEFPLYGCECLAENRNELLIYIPYYGDEMSIKKYGILGHSQVKKNGDCGTLILKYSYAKRLGVV